ncbi:MAG: heparan-alpha-glucosaminide N-acetyltransferase domain-containing protein [Bacteroidales bacterium]
MKRPDFSRREWLPDQLRGWAVIWMVLVHSVEVFLRQSEWSQPVAQAALFLGAVPAAPVFMLLMGYYALPSTNPVSAKPIIRLVYRPAKLVFWGLLLNIGLNANLLIHNFSGQIRVNPLQYLFGIDILLLAGFSLLLVRLISLARPHWLIWMLLALLSAFFGNRFTWGGDGSNWSHYLMALLGGDFSWSYFPLFPWAAYPLAGAAVRELVRSRPYLLTRARYRFYALLPALALFLAYLPEGWRISINLPDYYHHGPLFFVWALSFILLLALLIKGMLRYRSSSCLEVVRFLGVRVTSFYVIQWLLIGNIGTFLYRSVSLPGTLGLFAALLSGSALLTYLYFLKIKKNDLQP